MFIKYLSYENRNKKNIFNRKSLGFVFLYIGFIRFWKCTKDKTASGVHISLSLDR
jgi:hypothetical protein